MAPPTVSLPPRRLAAGEGDVAQVEDGERVGLRVEDPALKWHQVVAGEQQVEIPVGGWGGKEAGMSRCDGGGTLRSEVDRQTSQLNPEHAGLRPHPGSRGQNIGTQDAAAPPHSQPGLTRG